MNNKRAMKARQEYFERGKRPEYKATFGEGEGGLGEAPRQVLLEDLVRSAYAGPLAHVVGRDRSGPQRVRVRRRDGHPVPDVVVVSRADRA